jgi:RNA polymerase sigma-70 factor (ECF subfamily)
MDAMDRGDVDAVVSMLAQDAAWSMPPLASWFRGDDVASFLALGPLSGKFRWRRVAAHANGQVAVGAYTWHEDEGAYLPFALDVLTFEGAKIKEVTAFIPRSTHVDPPHFATWPDQPPNPDMVGIIFERAGLPTRLN